MVHRKGELFSEKEGIKKMCCDAQLTTNGVNLTLSAMVCDIPVDPVRNDSDWFDLIHLSESTESMESETEKTRYETLSTMGRETRSKQASERGAGLGANGREGGSSKGDGLC